MSRAAAPGPGGTRVVLAVDPGTAKCGMAVCAPGAVLVRAIVAPDQVAPTARDWHRRFGITEVIVGDRTGAAPLVAALAQATGLPVRRVDEHGTTLRARARYFQEHPPRGWRRLVPLGLQTPPEPYDDYVAVLLAEAALAQAPPGTETAVGGAEAVPGAGPALGAEAAPGDTDTARARGHAADRPGGGR